MATLAAVLLAFGIASLVAAGGLAWRHVHTSRKVIADAQQRARTDTGHAAAAIDALLASVLPLTERASQELGRGNLSESKVADLLFSLAAGDAAVTGMGAAYEPFAFSSSRRLFAPYVTDERRRVQIEDRYDYTTFDHRWYGDALLDGAMWNEPLEDSVDQGMDALYTVPFARPRAGAAREGPAGVVFAGVSADAIEKVLDALDLGTSGYAFVFSSQGRYVTHPRRELVARRATIFETAWDADDTALHAIAIHGLKGERGFVESIDPATGQASWIVYEPIKTTGWTLAVVYIREAFQLDADRERRGFFRTTAAAVAGAVLIGLALFTTLIVAGRWIWLWSVATVMSAALAGGIVALWWLSSLYPAIDAHERTKVLDAAGAEGYLHSYERDAGHAYARLPTGVFVKSIEFLSSTNVAVTGFIWQRFPAPAPSDPQFSILEADKPEIREVSRHRAGADDVVLWSFAATLREHLSYEKYPFDRQDVWIRLRQKGMADTTMLLPDLGSYADLDPLAGPGVAADLVLPGWQVTGSYFDYRPGRYNTNFGFERLDEAAGSPELYFNIDVSRRFLGPFVSNVVPLGVAGVMIFSLLLISSKNDALSRFAGFTAKDIVKGAAAVFFVISFQHIALRNALASPHLIYFEYFYFTTYLGLLLVIMNGILFASNAGGAVVEFRDNLVPKIAYWPAAMTCLFIVTLMVFY